MTHLTPIFAVWDNNAEALGAEIGVPGVTVRQWRNRQSIPSAYWQRIIIAAGRRDVLLHLSQFIRPIVIDDQSDDGSWADAIKHSPNMRVEEHSTERVVVCDVCDNRVDQMTACTFVDCPHSERRAA